MNPETRAPDVTWIPVAALDGELRVAVTITKVTPDRLTVTVGGVDYQLTHASDAAHTAGIGLARQAGCPTGWPVWRTAESADPLGNTYVAWTSLVWEG